MLGTASEENLQAGAWGSQRLGSDCPDSPSLRKKNPLTLFFFFLYALFGTDIFIENTATRKSSKQSLDYHLINANGEIR